VRQLLHDGYRKVVLNVERVACVDSTGLAEIVRIYINVGRLGGTLKLINLTRRFEDLLVITKLHDLVANYTYL
jgi:anti-sigma B factor antagonist